MMICGLITAIWFCSPAVFITQQNWEETRVIAETQHEIVLLLIEKEEFDKVPEAARQIFSLHFPKQQEPRVVKEAELLTSALLHHNQVRIAHQILDDALNAVTTPGAKAALHKEKGYIYKKEGKTDDAMREFKIGLELEKQITPQ